MDFTDVMHCYDDLHNAMCSRNFMLCVCVCVCLCVCVCVCLHVCKYAGMMHDACMMHE